MDERVKDQSDETDEWLDALDSVEAFEGIGKVDDILDAVVTSARRKGAKLPFAANTAYVNTIPPEAQPPHPGDRKLEQRIRRYVRWNAAAMVVKANKESSELGGHIASFQSAATLYDTGFMHFWHACNEKHGGDLIYFQGHSSPGIYARAFLEGRLSEEQLVNFRQEVGRKGLSSYPHPWLMPDFWQFPTVSMGLGPLMGIYQARFLRYLHCRGLADTAPRKVWVFCGDGEMDEPESLGAISLAGREKLDNLIFVINCNLQRLDGPVRGNGKIVQELEADFRGAGWNVIKCLWGSGWDVLLAKDTQGKLRQLMEECVDGEYQDFKSKDGAYIRKNFFGRYPETAAMVKDWTDAEIWALTRGGHDSVKVYAAYKAAVEHKGQPTVILAKTVKGYGMGAAGEGQMIAHQAKKLGHDALRAFRERFQIPVTDADLDKVPLLRFAEDSEEMKYLRERRAALGGYLPSRRRKSESLPVPPLSIFDALLKATAEGREISTTMAFVRILTALLRDKDLGPRVVPIVPDESRTFGMEGLFRQVGIFSQVGQLVSAAGRRSAHVLSRGSERPDPSGGHQRAGRDGLVHRRGHILFDLQRADDPLLHLLFDVRFPTRRRSRLGRRRHADARLSDRRHVRPHHPERRGSAARGRAQPCSGLDHPELRNLRSHLCLRTGGDRPCGAEPHARRSGRYLLLHHNVE